MALMRTLPAASVDAVIVDPPYGTTDLAWDVAPPLAEWWAEINRITKERAIVAVFSAQPFTSEVIAANRRHYRYELIWSKTKAVGFLDANRRPLRAHENILIFARRFMGSIYNPQKTPGKPYRSKHGGGRASRHYRSHQKIETINTGDRHPKSVLQFAHDRGGIHPTQKPVALIEWLVKSYTNPGDVVFDGYMGSGTTGEACMRQGRRFIGVELDRGYFNHARRRITSLWTSATTPNVPRAGARRPRSCARPSAGAGRRRGGVVTTAALRGRCRSRSSRPAGQR
jgi:site-specific DNA-methyltransferase (adenine-specific)